MLRSIKSAQRKIRIMALKVDATGLILSGPDAKQLKAKKDSQGDPIPGSFEMKVPFAEDNAEVVIIHDKASIGVITLGSTATTNKDLSIAATGDDFSCEVLIIGSDTAEKY